MLDRPTTPRSTLRYMRMNGKMLEEGVAWLPGLEGEGRKRGVGFGKGEGECSCSCVEGEVEEGRKETEMTMRTRTPKLDERVDGDEECSCLHWEKDSLGWKGGNGKNQARVEKKVLGGGRAKYRVLSSSRNFTSNDDSSSTEEERTPIHPRPRPSSRPLPSTSPPSKSRNPVPPSPSHRRRTISSQTLNSNATNSTIPIVVHESGYVSVVGESEVERFERSKSGKFRTKGKEKGHDEELDRGRGPGLELPQGWDWIPVDSEEGRPISPARLDWNRDSESRGSRAVQGEEGDGERLGRGGGGGTSKDEPESPYTLLLLEQREALRRKLARLKLAEKKSNEKEEKEREREEVGRRRRVERVDLAECYREGCR